jgi:uncharacterized membrane protein YhiD involved in acid resistance
VTTPLDTRGSLLKYTGIALVCFMCVSSFTVPSIVSAQDRAARQDSVSSSTAQGGQSPLEPSAEAPLFPPEALLARDTGDSEDAFVWSWGRMLDAGAAMLGAILLSLPLSSIYLRTKAHHEFDSSVLFSIVILAALIAGVLVVVQGSIATALSLAGVVTAVRFRSSLKDSNDAVYLLGAIAIGLAAGSHLLDVALVISLVLSATLLFLWRARLDAVRKMLVPEWDCTECSFQHDCHRHLDHHRHDRQRGSSKREEKPIPVVQEKGGRSREKERDAERSERIGYFVIQTTHPERTRLLVEMFLERETKRWRLDGSTGNGNGDHNGHGSNGLRGNRDANGRTTLMYLVRFRKRTQPEALLERIRAVGAPGEFTAELDTDAGVKERMA